jgi:hypothetical protein
MALAEATASASPLPEVDDPALDEDLSSAGEPPPSPVVAAPAPPPPATALTEGETEAPEAPNDEESDLVVAPDDEAATESTAEGPAPGFVGEVEYHDRYVAPTPPSSAALDRDATLEPPKKGKRFKRPGSPQHFGAEIKLGPYLPDVDRRYSGDGPGPYENVFGETDDLGNAIGEPKDAVMVAGAFEWQIVYLAGPLGLGLQVAFMRDKANALIAEPVPEGEPVRSSADATTFSVLPLALQPVYRFELVADRWKVPLVPYVKAGLAYAFWWSKDGSGDISSNDAGEKGRGGTWGWQLNTGGMLRLDFLEPGTARAMDRTTGINHTYLFGEYQLSRVDGFGSNKSISLGDSTWFAGLAIEF